MHNEVRHQFTSTDENDSDGQAISCCHETGERRLLMLRMEGSCKYTGHAVEDRRQEIFLQSGEPQLLTIKKLSRCVTLHGYFGAI
jgi:hypothetical protein